MEHAEIGRARANALLTNGVITAGFVALMLCAGLWPFTFAPSNNAVFDKKGGISFSRPAAIFDADTLNPAEKAVLAESTVTIAIRVSPSGESPWFISQIVTFTDGNRLCAIVGQWKSHLVLKTFPDRTRAGREPSAEVAVRNILNAGTTRDIVIVTGRAGQKSSWTITMRLTIRTSGCFPAARAVRCAFPWAGRSAASIHGTAHFSVFP